MAYFNPAWDELTKQRARAGQFGTDFMEDTTPEGMTQTGQATSTTSGPSPETEASAYQTGFAGLAADPNFGRVDPGAVSAYYDLAGKRAFGEGNERINAILAERGFGPQRVGQGVEMAGRLGRDIEINRAGAELGMAQQGAQHKAARDQMIGQSRYGALTRGSTTKQSTFSANAPGQQNPYGNLGQPMGRPTGLAPRSGMQNWSVGNWGTSPNLQRIISGGSDPSRWVTAPQGGNPWAGKV